MRKKKQRPDGATVVMVGGQTCLPTETHSSQQKRANMKRIFLMMISVGLLVGINGCDKPSSHLPPNTNVYDNTYVNSEGDALHRLIISAGTEVKYGTPIEITGILLPKGRESLHRHCENLLAQGGGMKTDTDARSKPPRYEILFPFDQNIAVSLRIAAVWEGEHGQEFQDLFYERRAIPFCFLDQIQPWHMTWNAWKEYDACVKKVGNQHVNLHVGFEYWSMARPVDGHCGVNVFSRSIDIRVTDIP